MEPERFRTLSELAEEDLVVGKQKTHSLPFEASDTLRSVYSTGQDDDGTSVYFSVGGSRASSMRTEGNGTIKASFSEGQVSDASGDVQEDDGDEGYTLNNDDMVDRVVIEKGADPPCGEQVLSFSQDVEVPPPHAFSFSQDPEVPPTFGSSGTDQLPGRKEDTKQPQVQAKRDDTPMPPESDKEEFAVPEDSQDKEGVVPVRLRSQPLLSEAESVGPVLFSHTTTDRVELQLPTPIHEEQKSCEMSPERPKDASSPCKLCLERQEQLTILEKRLEQMRQDVSQAYSEVSKYKKQIVDMQQEQTSARDDQVEQLQEEMRYLQVVHTEEISALCAENGMLRQQLQDSSHRDEYPQYDYRDDDDDYEARRPQRTREPGARKPRKIILPSEEPRHSDSPDQIGYSPLGAARIQFK